MSNDEKDPLGSSEGAWIFLSHSHRDFDQVRLVRNALEERGHRPLMFFLKCMDDDSPDLPDLIRREIEARTWFLLCDSPNAKASPWVRAEVEMIKRLDGKVYETVDLEGSLDQQIERIHALSQRATVFLSYAHADKVIAERIAAALRREDFAVWTPTEILPGAKWDQQILSAIDAAIERGFVLPLVSQAAVDSQFVRAEIQYALNHGTEAVVPVVIDPIVDTDTVAAVAMGLVPRQWFSLRGDAVDEQIEELVSHLKRNPRRRADPDG